MLQPDRRAAAFRGLIGPNRRIKAQEMADGCMAFYRTVFNKLNGDDALKAMNDALNREIERDREIARRYLSDQRARFEEMRREFFFIDLYPENSSRFDFTFEECQRPA